MAVRRSMLFLAASAVLVGACASTEQSSGVAPSDAPTSAPPSDPPTTPAPDPAPSSDPEPTTEATVASEPATTELETTGSATTEPEPAELETTTSPSSTEDPASTRPRRTTTTTTTVPPVPPDVYDPKCVVVIRPGDSLGLIATRFDDETVTAASLQVENGITDSDVIFADELLDVCVDNGLDDITGEQRVKPKVAKAAAARYDTVVAQQEKLNDLFARYGIRELLVDGISGPVTQQRLCAARVALGLPVNRDDMKSGSREERILMRTKRLPIPFTTALNSDRWVLVDRTCQIMFAGEGAERLSHVFATSTGEEGFETRDQNLSAAFRYDPAADNDGWHNSSKYPVAIDNPLNGNMYKPVYFDGGQAIHGSNNVPTTPQSKGCVRLRVDDQETLVGWLGLRDLTAATWSPSTIGVTVNVQGEYVPD